MATPVARAFAKDFNVDINLVKGTGPVGRITKTDIQKFLEGAGAPQLSNKSVSVEKIDLVTYEPLTQIRKAIAKNMTLSKENVVPMAVHEEVEVSELIRIREKFKS